MTGSADGVLAAGTQLAAGELAAALLPGARSPLTGLGRTLIDLTPGPVVDITVALLEARDKPLLMANLVGGAAGAGAAAGRVRRAHQGAARLLIAGPSALAGVAAASRPDAATGASALASAAGAAAGIVALEALARSPRRSTRVAVAALAAAATLGARRVGEREPAAVSLPAPAAPLSTLAAPFEVAGLSPLLTPNADFYETDVTFPPPVVDAGSWRLRVHGLVDRPLELSFAELTALGVEERDATLVCVHNPVGGPRIGTARWLGVPVGRLLERAGVRPQAEQLVARSVDGFSAGVPLDRLADSLVVVGMNGRQLPAGHGFPARLLTPGLYGYDANTKWLGELELTSRDGVTDYWTKRGWPGEPARVEPSARIDVPAHRHRVAAGALTVAGVAWAPPVGVTGVELSVDGGAWQAAELGPELDPAAWRQWRIDVPLDAGRHELRVRTAGQREDGGAPPYPSGARGLHTVTVEAGEAAGRPGRFTAARVVAEQRARLAAQGAAAWRRHSPA